METYKEIESRIGNDVSDIFKGFSQITYKHKDKLTPTELIVCFISFLPIIAQNCAGDEKEKLEATKILVDRVMTNWEKSLESE